jgi:hypothetical protein
MPEVETKQYLKWSDRYGNKFIIMEGNGDDIFFNRSYDGVQHATMISREKLIQFAKMLEG